MLTGLAKEIWTKKYKAEGDKTWADTAVRVGTAIAFQEKDQYKYADAFSRLIETLTLIPGGRITAGAGTRNNFLLNCAVLPVEDSMREIMESQTKAVVMFQSAYGVGYNYSKLRPKGTKLKRGGVASGPVSFMHGFNAWGELVETGGARRAAQIAVLNIHHPDILDFIDAKRIDGKLAQFNISVGITQEFVDAVELDLDFDLGFDGEIMKTIRARDLWDKLCESGWLYNDPGILMIDEVNRYNNGYYLYTIDATNPCGELPLPPYGVCCLGNINLTKFVIDPFSADSHMITVWENFDQKEYKWAIRMAVRFLDNVLDVSDYPYQEIIDRVQGDRRIGLNPLAGLGSTLAMLKLSYDSKEAINFVSELTRLAMEIAYDESVELAIEKGAFPNYDQDKYLNANFIKEKLPIWLKDKIALHGIRNIALLTVPPVGTGSLIAGNISNGLEPIFSLEYNRKVRQPDGTFIQEPVEDYAWGLYKNRSSDDGHWGTPDYFKTSREINPKAHVDMQAVIQQWIDGSLSKTANVPESFTLEEYKDLMLYAIKKGVKGFTTFREGTREGVLTEKKETKPVVVEHVPIALDSIRRPRVLDGKTYQIKEEDNHRTYCTVNHVEIDGKKVPWEIFFYSSSRNNELYAAVGRLASRIMRKTGDVQAVIDELKEIGGDHGYITQEYGYVQSKPMHFAFLLEEYMNGLTSDVPSPNATTISGGKCPECGAMEYFKEGGCSKCRECGYSACG